MNIRSHQDFVNDLESGKFGGIYDLPESIYRRAPGMNISSLKELNEDSSPAHFKYTMENPTEPTKAMLDGTMWHTALIEPESFDQHYAVFQYPVDQNGMKLTDGRTKIVKDAKKAFEATLKGRIAITEDEAIQLAAAKKSFDSHPFAPGSLADCKEVSFFWTDPVSGIKCKGKADSALIEQGFVFDVKSVGTRATERQFILDCKNFKHHWQAAFYLDGMGHATGREFKKFAWIVIERQAPYGINIFYADDATIEAGRMRYQNALQTLKECQSTNHYPSYSTDIKTISLPDWAV